MLLIAASCGDNIAPVPDAGPVDCDMAAAHQHELSCLPGQVGDHEIYCAEHVYGWPPDGPCIHAYDAYLQCLFEATTCDECGSLEDQIIHDAWLEEHGGC